MISAVDTNVLLDILIPNADYAAAALETLEKLSGKGSLVISEMVFAELSSQFPSLEELNTFLDDTDIKLVNSNDHALYEASLAWKKYLEDRKKNQKCPHCGEILPGRFHIISDFIIGGHAKKCADQLVTRDRGFYRVYFKDLKIVDPTK
jgi:predicted nucleic acid-binding protein